MSGVDFQVYHGVALMEHGCPRKDYAPVFPVGSHAFVHAPNDRYYPVDDHVLSNHDCLVSPRDGHGLAGVRRFEYIPSFCQIARYGSATLSFNQDWNGMCIHLVIN